MTLSEYYRFRLAQLTDSMYNKYLPQRDAKGTAIFLYDPYPELIEFIRSYVDEIQNIEPEDDEEIIQDENRAYTLVECIS